MTVLKFEVGDASQAALPPEQNLFLAVISVAVCDYRGSITGMTSAAPPQMTATQKQAEAWLFSPLHEEDFTTVCRLADVEPEFVRSIARRAQEYTPTSPVLARRERLRKILPATTAVILERMPEYTKQNLPYIESKTLQRDLRTLGALRVEGEWRIPE